MLKTIMQRYLIYHDLDQFREQLNAYLRGDSTSTPNKIFLKKAAMMYFYGKQFQSIINAINEL